ncbi:MAG: rod shape-determining protein [Dehalococcoidia bacterium]|nr:rod shape-determining protein [Dehalococcoidia bacterium]
MAFEFLQSKKAGIDLGTANILVYVKGQGIIVNEPSVVARHNRDNAIVAVGNEARAMQGRTPGSISVIRPMRDGVIADYLTTEAMLRYFIGFITGRFNLVRPEIMVTVPAGVTSVEQRAVRDAAEQAGARKPAHLVPEPLAAAIGARIPIGSARGNMIVNIGGGRTEAAVISLYGIVVSESVRMAGDRIDEAIMAYVRRRHNLVIGEKTAEEIKIAVGSAIPVDEGLNTQVRGRDQLSGLPKTITLQSTEVSQSIQDSLGTIVQTVRAVLEKTPPELASDVIDRGIVLTGGGALLRHMDELLTQETGVPCYVADNPLECVAIGAGIALDHLEVIKRSLPTEEENLVGMFPQPER